MYSEKGLDFIPVSVTELKNELYFLFNFFKPF